MKRMVGGKMHKMMMRQKIMIGMWRYIDVVMTDMTPVQVKYLMLLIFPYDNVVLNFAGFIQCDR